jgi:hypothetical protein
LDSSKVQKTPGKEEEEEEEEKKDGGLGFGDFRDCKKLVESSSCCIITMSRKCPRKKREMGIRRSLWTLAMSAPTQYTILSKTNAEKNNNMRIKA